MNQIHKTMLVELNERQLFNEVKNHLRLMINRLIFHIQPTDIFQAEIKKNYPFAFELAHTGVQVLESILKRQASSSETSYLAIYFELALRKFETSEIKRVAPVCPDGGGTAALICRQINRVLGPQLEIYQCLNQREEQQNLNRFFAVFTTVPLKNCDSDTPVIHLTSLCNDNWLQSEWSRVIQAQQFRFQATDFYLKKLKSGSSYRDHLIELLSELTIKGVVKDSFSKQILAREDKNTTIFGHGVAVPHAILEDTSRILCSLGICGTDYQNASDSVELIVLVGIPERLTTENEIELLRLYDEIFALASDSELKAKINEHNTNNDFLKLIRKKARSSERIQVN